jgi:hypothetical protein
MMLLFALEWSGCVLGLFGALLQALNVRFSAWGFVLFLLSNFAWLGFAYLTSTSGLSVMNIGYTATSILGIYRWRKALIRVH